MQSSRALFPGDGHPRVHHIEYVLLRVPSTWTPIDGKKKGGVTDGKSRGKLCYVVEWEGNAS